MKIAKLGWLKTSKTPVKIPVSSYGFLIPSFHGIIQSDPLRTRAWALSSWSLAVQCPKRRLIGYGSEGYFTGNIGETAWPYIYIYIYELQPKFGLMESSIRAVSIFWKLSWGLENDNTLFKNDSIYLYAKTWKTIIHSSKSDDLDLYTKYWPWPIYMYIIHNMCVYIYSIYIVYIYI